MAAAVQRWTVTPSGYGALLRVRGIRWLLPTALLGRLPIAMTGLAITLLVTRHGTYARAGVVMSAYVVGSGLAGPLVGRAADRLGRRRVLVVAAVLNALLLAALAYVPKDVPGLLVGVAVLAGTTMPPLSAAARSLWSALLEGPARDTMYALDATVQEVIFIVGPMLVALLVAFSDPQVALAVTGLVGLVGVTAFVAHPLANHVATTDGTHPGGLWRMPSLRRIVLVGSLLVMSFNFIDLAIISFVSGRTANSQAGAVLAVWAAGSMTGGLIYGARPALARLPLPVMIGFVAATLGVLSLSPGKAGLAVLLFCNGLTIAPTIGRIYGEVGRMAPPAAATEAFSWLATGFLAGTALGAALSGLSVTHWGPRPSFLVAAGIAALAAAAATLRVEPLPGAVEGEVPAATPAAATAR